MIKLFHKGVNIIVSTFMRTSEVRQKVKPNLLKEWLVKFDKNIESQIKIQAEDFVSDKIANFSSVQRLPFYILSDDENMCFHQCHWFNDSKTLR